MPEIRLTAEEAAELGHSPEVLPDVAVDAEEYDRLRGDAIAKAPNPAALKEVLEKYPDVHTLERRRIAQEEADTRAQEKEALRPQGYEQEQAFHKELAEAGSREAAREILAKHGMLDDEDGPVEIPTVV